jgi:hypothetical protein
MAIETMVGGTSSSLGAVLKEEQNSLVYLDAILPGPKNPTRMAWCTNSAPKILVLFRTPWTCKISVGSLKDTCSMHLNHWIYVTVIFKQLADHPFIAGIDTQPGKDDTGK